MPSITITDEQQARLDAIADELSDHAGAYASVTPHDVFEYLLDLEASIDDTPLLERTEATGIANDEIAETPESDSQQSADPLEMMMGLLKTHDDKWRKSSGDEPYEVDLPDGSVETARTKDDVKGILFKHY